MTYKYYCIENITISNPDVEKAHTWLAILSPENFFYYLPNYRSYAEFYLDAKDRKKTPDTWAKELLNNYEINNIIKSNEESILPAITYSQLGLEKKEHKVKYHEDGYESTEVDIVPIEYTSDMKNNDDWLYVDETWIVNPVMPKEVWAAGVTYSDSMRERQAESESPDVYAKVYNADRPEIFFKGTPRSISPPILPVSIREDSGWDVPESELTVVLIKGDIAGYTIGNDMSSRSIEGENPLYLPQAKLYDNSCSFGPCIISSEGIDPQSLGVELEIERDKKVVFSGKSSTSLMKRNVFELVDWLKRYNHIPEVTILMTGTGIIPPQDFTLKEDDIIRITIEKIGTLVNRVDYAELE